MEKYEQGLSIKGGKSSIVIASESATADERGDLRNLLVFTGDRFGLLDKLGVLAMTTKRFNPIN